MIAAGLLVLPILVFVPAPYGRHARGGFGPSMDARAAWIVMESPSVWLFAWVFFASEGSRTAWAVALAGLWELHYLQRTVVFPLLMRNPGRKPVLIAALAFTFNLWNASQNAAALARLGAEAVTPGAAVVRAVGVALFLAGFLVNVHSDAILRRLRQPGGPRYSVPTGGAFALVTSPNYLGEIAEWGGFALASGTLPALAFFVFTIANLAPRAVSHHRWYKSQFPDYPKERRALIPRIL
jgi:steroid 5-alpha reductase family enzyme